MAIPALARMAGWGAGWWQGSAWEPALPWWRRHGGQRWQWQQKGGGGGGQPPAATTGGGGGQPPAPGGVNGEPEGPWTTVLIYYLRLLDVDH